MKKILKNLYQKITYWLGVITVGLLVGLSLQFVRAWTEPNQAPPGGNVGAPINTGPVPQTKFGNVTLNALGLYGSGPVLQVPSGTVDTQDVWLRNANSGAGAWASALGGGGLSGSGTANYVSKWTGGTALGNSQVFDNGTSVGIGTAAPIAKLHVNGTNPSDIGAITAYSPSVFGIYSMSSHASGYGVFGYGASRGVEGLGNSSVPTSIGIYGAGQAWAGYFAGKIRATSVTFGDGTVQTTAAAGAAAPVGNPVKAWVNWSRAGGISAQSGGISGVATNGGGASRPVVSFSTPMASSNYAVICNGTIADNPPFGAIQMWAYNKTVNSFNLFGAHAADEDTIQFFTCTIFE